MVQITDKALLIGEISIESFDGIFRQYAKPLFYYAAKFVGDDQAKDIVQDTFALVKIEKLVVV